ncbi:MAG: hypothetical protein AAF429_03445 [Pseudomonadota bacterium]
MSYFDLLENHLIEDLIKTATEDGKLTFDDFLTKLQRYMGKAENFYRLDEFGDAHKTGTLALYTKGFSDGNNWIQAGNFAKDISLRNSDVTVLDHTKMGRLVLELARMDTVIKAGLEDGASPEALSAAIEAETTLAQIFDDADGDFRASRVGETHHIRPSYGTHLFAR